MDSSCSYLLLVLGGMEKMVAKLIRDDLARSVPVHRMRKTGPYEDLDRPIWH